MNGFKDIFNSIFCGTVPQKEYLSGDKARNLKETHPGVSETELPLVLDQESVDNLRYTKSMKTNGCGNIFDDAANANITSDPNKFFNGTDIFNSSSKSNSFHL